MPVLSCWSVLLAGGYTYNVRSLHSFKWKFLISKNKIGIGEATTELRSHWWHDLEAQFAVPWSTSEGRLQSLEVLKRSGTLLCCSFALEFKINKNKTSQHHTIYPKKNLESKRICNLSVSLISAALAGFRVSQAPGHSSHPESLMRVCSY